MAAHRDYSVFVWVDARSTMKNELETKAAKAVALPAYMVHGRIFNAPNMRYP